MPGDYEFLGLIVRNRNHSVVYICVTNRLSRRTSGYREGNRTGFALQVSMQGTDLLGALP